MKLLKKLAVIGSGVAALAITGVASAAPALPRQCQGVDYAHTYKVTQAGVTVKGTNDNDLFFVSTAGATVNALGGNDCVVVTNGAGNTINGGAGNDVIVASGAGNQLNGGAGKNYLSATGAGNVLNGTGGLSTCVTTFTNTTFSCLPTGDKSL